MTATATQMPEALAEWEPSYLAEITKETGQNIEDARRLFRDSPRYMANLEAYKKDQQEKFDKAVAEIFEKSKADNARPNPDVAGMPYSQVVPTGVPLAGVPATHVDPVDRIRRSGSQWRIAAGIFGAFAAAGAVVTAATLGGSSVVTLPVMGIFGALSAVCAAKAKHDQNDTLERAGAQRNPNFNEDSSNYFLSSGSGNTAAGLGIAAGGAVGSALLPWLLTAVGVGAGIAVPVAIAAGAVVVGAGLLKVLKGARAKQKAIYKFQSGQQPEPSDWDLRIGDRKSWKAIKQARSETGESLEGTPSPARHESSERTPAADEVPKKAPKGKEKDGKPRSKPLKVEKRPPGPWSGTVKVRVSPESKPLSPGEIPR